MRKLIKNRQIVQDGWLTLAVEADIQPVVPAELAILHQFCAMLLLTSVLLTAHAIRHATPAPRIVFPGPDHGQTARGTPFHGTITQTSAEDPQS